MFGGVYFLAKDYVDIDVRISFIAGYVFASFFLSPDLDLFYPTCDKKLEVSKTSLVALF